MESRIVLAMVHVTIGVEGMECVDLLSDYWAICCRITFRMAVRREEVRTTMHGDRWRLQLKKRIRNGMGRLGAPHLMRNSYACITIIYGT